MLDLPTIWAGLLAVAVFMYVILDGFDLGIGILFPFAADTKERDQMMASIAPVWDGNETWLILGGGGLLATFPVAYAVLMPALYIPVLIMLIGLIFRGVAFEFRHQARGRWPSFWSGAFFVGSLAATVAQGFVLGGFLQGTQAETGGRFDTLQFAGGPFDWLTPFTLLVAAGLTAGYMLLGAAWLVWKADGPLLARANGWVRALAVMVGAALAAVSVATLFIDPQVSARWGVSGAGVDWGRAAPLMVLPLAAAGLLAAIYLTSGRGHHLRPYLLSIALFLTAYLGLAVSLWPYILPFELTPREAAAPENSLMFMLIGAAIILPMILAYTLYVYWVFRAKVAPDASYH